jgi:hypothetical protein
MSEGLRPQQQCCFCGQTIEGEEPRVLTLEVEDGGSQELYSHEVCLRRAVHPWVPLAL